MSGNNNHIDELIQQKLDGHKVKAPENAWKRLSGELHQPARTRFFWFSRAAAAVVLLLIAFGAGYFFSELNRDSDSRIVDTGEQVRDQALPDKNNGRHAADKAVSALDESDTGKNEPMQKDVQPAISNDLIAESQQEDVTDSSNENELQALEESKTDFISEEETAVSVVETEITQPIESRVKKETIAEQLEKTPPAVHPSAEGETPDDVPVMTDEMLHEMLIADDELAQDMLLKSDDNKNSKWSIGAVLSPMYSYRTVSGDAFTGTDEAVDAGYFNDNEQGITSIAGGISLDFSFNSRLSLSSGMFFSRVGQQNNDVLAYNDPDMPDLFKLATSTGTISINPRSFQNVIAEPVASLKDSIPGDYIVNSSLVQNLDYVEVPLVLKYKVIDSRFSVNVMGGLSPGILVNNRSYFSVEGQKMQTGTTENINNFIYNSILGLGLEYSISRKVALSMQPSFKYSLSPVNSGTGLEYHPYSLSWFTGISYTLD